MRTAVACRPRYESSNIRTWIGFRQLMLLAEEAVVQWFRDRGLGPRALYHEHGLGLEVVDSSVQLPAVVDVDDELVAEAVQTAPGRFAVTLRASREGASTLVLRGRVAVALVRAPDVAARRPVPTELAGLIVDDVTDTTGDAGGALTGDEPGACRWSWRAPYFLCHFSDRVQHSGHVRALEEIVDRFLAERGLSVRTLLAERAWIPVVSRARVRMLAAARMEETVESTFAVREILRRAAFDARMDSIVRRDGRPVHVATATILHGYAVSRGEGAGGLVDLDEATVAALTGRATS